MQDFASDRFRGSAIHAASLRRPHRREAEQSDDRHRAHRAAAWRRPPPGDATGSPCRHHRGSAGTRPSTRSRTTTAPRDRRSTTVTGNGARAAPQWRLLVKHPSGSLEAAVERGAAAKPDHQLGILAVLGASVALLVLSTRRAQRARAPADGVCRRRFARTANAAGGDPIRSGQPRRRGGQRRRADPEVRRSGAQ